MSFFKSSSVAGIALVVVVEAVAEGINARKEIPWMPLSISRKLSTNDNVLTCDRPVAVPPRESLSGVTAKPVTNQCN